MDFLPTRFDRDMWIRLAKNEKAYEYICTHVDNFYIFSVELESVMNQIQAVCIVNSVGPSKYYLENDLKRKFDKA
eukprot:6751670-Ditylum_brightwellii.AAC.1